MKINKDDEGDIEFLITIKDETLIIDFGKTIRWIGLNKEEAIELVRVIEDRLSEL